MKKLTFILGITLISLVSCKKTWTCDCKTNTTYNGTAGSSTSSTTIADAKKGDAEKTCDAIAAKDTYSTSNFISTSNCELNK